MITKGDLPIEIFWTFDSQVLTSENGIAISRSNSRSSALNIEQLEGHHRGVYKCIARNSAGEVDYSAELFVNGDHGF